MEKLNGTFPEVSVVSYSSELLSVFKLLCRVVTDWEANYALGRKGRIEITKPG